MIKRCHACMAKDTYQEFFWQGSLITDTFQCRTCRHIFRDYKGNVAEYHREKYRSSGEEGHSMYPEEERLVYLSNVIDCVKPHIDDHMTALEIGSGDGLFARQIKNHVSKITCSDIDSKMTKMCDDLGFESLTIDILQLSEDKKFDVVFGFDVLEHVLDLQAFKEKVNKIVNEWLVLQVPVDRTMVPPNNYNRAEADSFDGHSHYFSVASMSELFKDYFDIKQVFYGHRGKLARGPEILCIFKKKEASG